MNNRARNIAFVATGLIIMSSCHEKPTSFFLNEYNEFVYSRGETGYGDKYSLKLTQSDTVYFQRHKYNLKNEIKYCIIKAEEKEYIENELGKVKWAMLDSTYTQHGLEDGTNRTFYMKKGRATKSVFVYGKEGPAALFTIANWLDSFKSRKEFKSINKKINFGDLHRIVIVWPVIPRTSK